MAFRLETVVPWGRDLAEYDEVFALRQIGADARILDVASGPASFVAEAAASGWAVTGADPLYRFQAPAIAARFEAARASVIAQLDANHAAYRWDRIGSLHALEARRSATVRRFLRDYETTGPKRYVAAGLPRLPFADDAFDVALCAHFLFLNEASLGVAFVLESLRELCRVATEVRIYPLVRMDGTPGRALEPALAALRGDGWDAQTEAVEWNFQAAATERLVLSRRGEDGGRARSARRNERG